MKKILSLFFAALFAFGTLYAAEGGDRFTLKTLDGKSLEVVGVENGISFEKYKGKVVFLEFWGTHCPPCLISIPHYIDLQKKYQDKLAIVAVEVQGTPEAMLREFAKAKGMNYDIVPHENALAFIDYVQARSGWEGTIPFLIILDQEGNFVTSQVGLLSQDALEGVIQTLEKMHNKQEAKNPSTPTSPAKDGNSSM
jgi:thiol-disulfide isomerase/thioredoxin